MFDWIQSPLKTALDIHIVQRRCHVQQYWGGVNTKYRGSLMIQRLSLISQYQLPTVELYRGVAQLVNIERFKEVYYAADLWFYTV